MILLALLFACARPCDCTCPSDTGTGAGGSADTGGADTGVPDTGHGDTGGADTGGGDSGGPDTGATGDSDWIYGVEVPRAESWWIADGAIHHGAEAVTLLGINWFGLETTDVSLHGLWTGRSVEDFLDQVVDMGFNALRLPLSPSSIRPGTDAASWGQFGDVHTGREQLEYVLDAAEDRGLAVLLDVHTCDASAGSTTSSPTACDGYTLDDWHEDLATLASLAAEHPAVLGIDLFNEPYGLAWSDWRQQADDAAEVVLTTNPRILVFVEGVGDASDYGSAAPFWGENLVGAADDPPTAPASRVVYSPHVYGPSVYAQSYFSDPSFPDNMPPIWDEHFGWLMGDHAVAIGEFGGRYTDADATWQDAFVDYLVDRGSLHGFYWCLNPNSGDTGGVLLDDWSTVDDDKLALLQRWMAAASR